MQRNTPHINILQLCNIHTLPINPIDKLGNNKYYICMQGGNDNEEQNIT